MVGQTGYFSMESSLDLGTGKHVVTSSRSIKTYEISGGGARIRFRVQDAFNELTTKSGRATIFADGISRHEVKRIFKPVLLGGECVHYIENGAFPGWETGDRLYSYSYNIINNKVDGLHWSSGLVSNGYSQKRAEWKYKREYFVAISGHIVEQPYSQASKIPYDYSYWLKDVLNATSLSHMGEIGVKFPTPKTYDEGELYFDLELMVQIFIDDFKDHITDLVTKKAIELDERADWIKVVDKVYQPWNELLANNNITCVFNSAESYRWVRASPSCD